MAVTASRSARFRVRIRLLSSAEGGRRVGIRSGYRCNCWIGRMRAGAKAYNDAMIELGDVDELDPGQTAIGWARPAFPEYWTDVEAGSTIELCEGSRVVGTAEVLGLVPA